MISARCGRHSIRLRGHDYGAPGMCFVTICTQGRVSVFGEVVEGEMHMNTSGKVAGEEWFATSQARPYVMLHPREFVVMPNHVHGVIQIVGARRAVPVRT